MHTKNILTATLVAGFIALTPALAHANNIPAGVFDWPTGWEDAMSSTATSTFEGNTKQLKAEKPSKTKKSKQK